MMYNQKLVVALKHNGKILREHGDLVKLPFGSEFSVLVKNLNSRRAKFSLHIDGTDVLDGTEIIVNAHSETEIKRFIRNGNMNEGNAFKFIERTEAIENGPRGIKMDDGVIRVEFWFEKEKPVITTTYHRDVWWNDYYRRYPIYGEPFYGAVGASYTSNSDVKLRSAKSISKGTSLGGASGSNDVVAQAMNAAYTSNASLSDAPVSAEASQTMDSFNDAGITVPGSKVEQSFHAVYGFDSEAQSHVIVLRLAGKNGDVEVAKPVTVKTKPKCVTCGKLNKHTSKFCTDCGTALELL